MLLLRGRLEARLAGKTTQGVEELYRQAIELGPVVPIFQQALDNLLSGEGKD